MMVDVCLQSLEIGKSNKMTTLRHNLHLCTI